MFPVKRPKAGDTEEDLIREEKEFLEGLKARNVVPAAKVVKKGPKDQTCGPAKDIGGNRLEEVSTGGINEEQHGDNEASDPIVEHPLEAVLFEVKERAFDPLKLKEFGKNKEALQKVLRVEKNIEQNESSGSTTRKKSLFARTFDARKQAREKSTCSKEATQRRNVGVSEMNFNDASCKRAVGDEIHPYLAGMTEEEILEEQRKLLERLDPKLVEFIKSGKHRKCSEKAGVTAKREEPLSSVSMDIDDSNKDIATSTVQIKEDDLPINPNLVKKYPGMDKIELNKLEWAGVIKESPSTKLINSQSSKNARFDFNGMLLFDHTNDLSTYERALHNHGEEMDRPGYTMEELLTLARSINIQQRSTALETLGNIFAQAHTGIYDDVLEESIFSLMDYIDLIHVVRKGLDYVDSNTINSSLICLAAFLYPDLEEDCLDASHLWPDSRPHPLLAATSEENMKDTAAAAELKDFEFLQLDLLNFLIRRSDILVRIEYLVSTKWELLSEKGITSLLKILIRLARHSPSSVMKYEKILKFITENYVSPNWITLKTRDKSLKGIPLFHALKLVRILVESSVQNAMRMYNSYSVLPSVMSYLAYDQWREDVHVHEVENLILEAFKIWIGFLSFGIAIDEYLSLFPVLMQFLTFYGLATELNSFDLHHSSHLFALLTQILCFGNYDQNCQNNRHSHWDLVKDAVTSIEKHCIKTMKILSSPHLQGTYNIDLAVLSLGKGIEFLWHSLKYRDKESHEQQFQIAIQEFCSSKTYLLLTSNLTSHSTLLTGSSDKKSRYPSNYACVGGILWQGELNPVMRPNSPYHFLKHFVAYARSLNEQSIVKVLVNSNVQNFLSALCKKTEDSSDFFSRFEISCLLEILRTIPNDFQGKFLIAYNSVVHVSSCCKALFQDMLRVALETCCDDSDVDAVYLFYASYFLGNEIFETVQEPEVSSSKSTKVKFDDGGHPGDDKEKESHSRVLFMSWRHKIAEAHWVFHPLETLYKRVNSTPGYVRNHLSTLEQETRGCLSFIHQCLHYHRDSILQTQQDLVTVYCRICRIFMLGSPSVYIDELAIPKLKEILQILTNAIVFKTSNKPIFSNHKPSSSASVSFFDFYTELVNEYFDNSYFNEVFLAYLLLPLRSAEDSNVKSCFWKHEYLNCVKVNRDKILIPLDYLVRNPETDQKMLIIYTNLLKKKVVTCTLNPFLYELITTQLKNSLNFMTEKLKSDFELLCI